VCAKSTFVVNCRVNISRGLADRQGPLAELEGRSIVAHLPGSETQAVGDEPQATLVVQSLGKGCGIAQEVVDPSKFPEWKKCRAKDDLAVDALLKGVPALGQMRKGFQRLLEARDRLRVGETCARFDSRLSK
jgi:hypothetical protein